MAAHRLHTEQKPAGDKLKQGLGPKKTKKQGLTRKELKLAQALITKTDNISKAGRIAGYSDAQAAHKALKRVQRKMARPPRGTHLCRKRET